MRFLGIFAAILILLSVLGRADQARPVGYAPLWVPDDPLVPSQWALEAIGLPAAWDMTEGSDTITIAVIDSGVDRNHPDLLNVVTEQYDASMATPIFNLLLPSLSEEDDPVGHGTHVAGIIAARHDQLGIAGAAPRARVISIRIFRSDQWATPYAIARGIDLAVEHNAKIINLSIGGPDHPLIAEAVNRALDHGVLIVAAAGNSGPIVAPIYPAAYPGVLAVGATAPDGKLSYFSTPASWVKILAPGTEIMSTVPGGYRSASGTSMAAPYVSAVAALVWSLHPEWSAVEVRSRLTETASPLARKTGTGFGQVNAAQATH